MSNTQGARCSQIFGNVDQSVETTVIRIKYPGGRVVLVRVRKVKVKYWGVVTESFCLIILHLYIAVVG